ncbi:MAG: arylamine N-acetyltransferase [Luteolibacter sp.]
MSEGISSPLDRSLAGHVLDRLEIPQGSALTEETLRKLYKSWCLRVPFDNVRKLIHISSSDSAPLPGGTASDYFQVWLEHGTGGTCWAGAGALHALLSAMGFEADRALGTMLVAPGLPPNHGSVRVRLGGRNFLLDTSILHHEPLPLVEDEETRIGHPAWGVTCSKRDGRSHVRWRPLHKPDGFECRFEGFGIHGDDYLDRYEQTRGWSPFNYQVCARRNRGDEVIGLAFGHFITLRSDGSMESVRVDDRERRRILLEEFGMSRAVISRLPADRPTPPPPGSKTEAAGST